jgi:hypothetical protein
MIVDDQGDAKDNDKIIFSTDNLEEFVEKHILPKHKQMDGRLTESGLENYFQEELDQIHITDERLMQIINQDDNRKELGIADYDNDIETWADALEDKHGRFRYSRLKNYLDKQTTNPYHGKYADELFEELDSRDNIDYTVHGDINGSDGRKFNLFIETRDRPFEQYRQRLPDVDIAEDIFDYLLGKGCSPITSLAGIYYVLRDKGVLDSEGSLSYNSVSRKFDCSSLSVKQIEERILDRFNVGGGQQ